VKNEAASADGTRRN